MLLVSQFHFVYWYNIVIGPTYHLSV